MRKTINAWPGGMPTKLVHDYVGGKTVFLDLKAKYPDLVKPFRRSGRGDEYYRKTAIDSAMNVAEMNGDLLAPIKEKS